MSPLISLLAPRWLGVVCILLAVGLAGWLLLRKRRRNAWSMPLILAASGFGLAGAGCLFVPSALGMWAAIGAAALLLGMLIWLVLTSQWSSVLAASVGAVLVLGLGGWGGIPAGEGLFEVGKAVRQIEAVQPRWLWLLLLLPVIVYWSRRSLAGMGPARRWMAIGLRSSLILFLVLALAEVRLRQVNDTVTTLFLVDRSLSVPEEIDENAPRDAKNNPIDQRWERVKKFINESVEKRGEAHKRDKAGMIVFGRRPRLELPPSDAPRFNFIDVASNLDANYTDIAAAIKLALASFPEGSAKRIVLISDGNENIGNAEEQARIAKQNGVQIDVVPLGKGFKNQNEVLVQSVEVPPLTEQGSRFPIRVLIRSFNPNPVKGILELVQIAEGKETHVPPSPWGDVVLRFGLNELRFPPPKDRPKGSFTYRAKFVPKVAVVEGEEKPVPLGRMQNKEASTHVLALGQRRVLVVEKKPPPETPDQMEHSYLVEHLKGIGESKFRVDHILSTKLPKGKGDLAVFLSNYDCLILANVPAEDLDEDQQEVVRSNTEDQGCGLIMIGGPDSFGAGGWQGTPVEKALPVDCDIKALKVQGKGGLVMVMHACEMPDGNRAQKDVAKLAINKLGPLDMLGVVGLGWQGQEWHVPFQSVGDKREQMKRQVEKMTPGDMPDFDSPLQMAYDKLSDPKFELAKKHVIIISDGDPSLTNQALLGKMRNEKITVTTVGIATHGVPEDRQMLTIAQTTGGRYHKISNPKLLPEIYTKEVRLVSQSFLYERRFVPKLIGGGPTDGLPENLNPLYGFVRTTPKPAVTVMMPILGPPQGDNDFPVLAMWQYGLGKAVAFTSDARSGLEKQTWDRDWAGSQMYKRFWEQMVDYALRAVESGKLVMNTEYRDGKVRVTIDAHDKDNKPLTDLKLEGGVTSPAPMPGDRKKYELKFEQKNSGQYEAEFKADEAGSYFVTVQPVRMVNAKKKVVENGQIVEKDILVKEGFDSVRGGVTIPYSPEFADMEPNVILLEKLREITGGTTFEDTDRDLAEAAKNAAVFHPGPPSSRSLQPIWFWLVMLTGIFLFFDVAVRRIAVEPTEWWAGATRVWHYLRGQTVVESTTPQFLDRLKSKKAAIGEELEKTRAATRFDPSPDAPIGAPPPSAADMPASAPMSRPTRTAPSNAPGSAEEKADFTSRLMKAKKRAMDERDKK
ncbi:hypothetical protein AYO44_12720 [Planctomycetaceae bacterium SCGC AG-212-F19]|nr:hypothetical protein AYO44_12720 [Planctomycetaceae bacterium SCGC AG-212-F19]